jgi:hypothetical protein
MTLESTKKKRRVSACDIRSACKRESDSKYFRALFEIKWDYFVVKTDPEAGGFRTNIECCGRPLDVPTA